MIDRNPVLLIHGIADTLRKFDVMATHLEAKGWPVHRITLNSNYGTVCLIELAKQVDDYIKANFSEEQPIDLLGFSMGGVVTRYYLQRLGGLKKVQRYVSISAPNNGTVMAYTLPFKGVQQMRPNSQFLQDLNQDYQQLLQQIKVTIIWTPYDLMIIPANSSQMGIGIEKQFPVLLHALMVEDQRVLNAVTEALSEPINKS
ncbi:MAG: esterase/lipase family protein [Microcystaceae cyanobacterium]